MTAQLPISPSPVKKSPVRFVKWGAGLLIASVAAWFLWQWANDMSGIRREAPKVPTIIPLPPPPPPPPEKPPEPEPPVEEKVVEPEPTPEPEEIQPEEEAPPSPADDLAKPMDMDANAQTAVGGIPVGKGGGMAGSGGGRLGNGTFSQFMAVSFQRLLRDNPDLRNQAYKAQVDVWLSSSGEISRVELAQSSGNAEVDAQILAALRSAPRMNQRPPASFTVPMRVALQGRRPG
ncbi:energy transducer TonB [Pseudomonas sp. MAG733B]|uniref:energy transducer TonB family protein n=1 Tax=Pseudomonas sp. MAG733B TaxID=3122079 RepID=UPI0030CDA934